MKVLGKSRFSLLLYPNCTIHGLTSVLFKREWMVGSFLYSRKPYRVHKNVYSVFISFAVIWHFSVERNAWLRAGCVIWATPRDLQCARQMMARQCTIVRLTAPTKGWQSMKNCSRKCYGGRLVLNARIFYSIEILYSVNALIIDTLFDPAMRNAAFNWWLCDIHTNREAREQRCWSNVWAVAAQCPCYYTIFDLIMSTYYYSSEWIWILVVHK